MHDNWLEISDDNIDLKAIERQVQARLENWQTRSPSALPAPPEAIAKSLWREIIGDPSSIDNLDPNTLIQAQDCDIVPRQYVINWQNPILGPIHALLRRLINAEIRRFLFPSLEKQAFLNRQMVRMLKELTAENKRLRSEIETLRKTQK